MNTRIAQFGRIAQFSRAAVLAALALSTIACRSLGAGASGGSMDIDAPPPIPPQIDPSHLHFTRSRVQVGDVAPDFTLPRVGSGADASGELRLSSLRGKPVVLVFGSFT